MTTEAIQKFDINEAADKLKTKIRDAFMELLTPEQFKDMVMTELKRFTEETSTRDNYSGNRTPVPSEFSKICRGVFEQHIKDELKKLLDSPEYRTNWGGTDRMEISEAVQQWLTKHRRELIESTILTFAGSAAQAFLDNLRTHTPRF